MSRHVRITGVVRAVRTTAERVEVVQTDANHESVEVTHVPVGRVVDVAPAMHEEGDTTIIPVIEEVVTIERRLVLREEIHIRRVRKVVPGCQTVVLRSQHVAVMRAVPESLAGRGAGLFCNDIKTKTEQELIMNEETIVAVYDDAKHAGAAVTELLAAYIPRDAISQHDNGRAELSGGAQPRAAEPGLWTRLFGAEPEHDTSVYGRRLQSGATVLTVRVNQAQVEPAMAILERHGPVELDDGAEAGTASEIETTTRMPVAGAGVMGRTAPAIGHDEQSLVLSEERLTVGKRQVSHGTTKIHRFVVETPVTETVSLRDEHVTMERRPVTDGRAAGAPDFTDRTIEMTETAEEAVVSKKAFVKEEIVLRKQADERVETIRDTVRSEDVKIEKDGERSLAGASPATLHPAGTVPKI